MPPKLTVPERRAGKDARQVGPDRRARDRPGRAAGAGPEPAAARTSSATARSSCWSTIATISSTSADGPSSGCAGTCIQLDPTFACPLRMLGRAVPPRTRQPLARPPDRASCRCGSRASSSVAAAHSTARSPSSTRSSRQRVHETAPGLLELPGCGGRHRRKAARRDRPDRPLQERRPTRPPQRRRTARSELRPHPTPPTRPRRQPPTQRRPLPDRDHPSPLPPAARAYLERKRAKAKAAAKRIRCLKRLLARVVFNTLKASPALT